MHPLLNSVVSSLILVLKIVLVSICKRIEKVKSKDILRTYARSQIKREFSKKTSTLSVISYKLQNYYNN